MLLEGQVAIITGGASGIGKAASLLFAQEGASVVLIDRSERGTEVEKEIVERGGDGLFIQMDLRDQDALHNNIQAVIDRFGKVDILFSNAGINPHIGTIEETSDESWDEILSINLSTCFHIIREVVPHMARRGYGSIIATSSISGRVWAADHSVPYGVTKVGVEAIVKSVAAQYGPKGIRANAILPGFIETPLNWVTDPEVKQRIVSRIPLRRAGTPEDVAKVALFLASHLSDYPSSSMAGLPFESIRIWFGRGVLPEL
jgi:3-oxoacyl-[acyl-carrier protein] reductase